MKQFNRRKVVVVGGSNGIGLAVSLNLMRKGFFVEMLDICEPDSALIGSAGGYAYRFCDLLDFDRNLFEELSRDESVGVLFISAGIGKVCDFENLNISEIDRTFKINTVSSVKIIRSFYSRIKSNEKFYCGIMGSVAGLVSSPLFSVYAASKAAVCRFTESVNIELEQGGYENRILNISPGSIKGTRFNGGQNDLSQMSALSSQIIERFFHSEELFIPQYDEVYSGVINRYNNDPHAFGVQSYQYKTASGRMKSGGKEIVGYLSGTFDLFHIGHLNLLRRAKAQCDRLIVGVHPSGLWKGKETFIPLNERMEIIAACKYVDKVVVAPDEDNEAWKEYRYHRLFVGGDYKGSERFKDYENYFKNKDVKIIYFPYTKGTSSTKLRERLSDKNA